MTDGLRDFPEFPRWPAWLSTYIARWSPRPPAGVIALIGRFYATISVYGGEGEETTWNQRFAVVFKSR